jgi:hypothetical protein
MAATLTLDLFRPAILDPVRDDAVPVARRRGATSRPASGGERQAALVSLSNSGPTLDDLVVGVWEDLTAHRTVACPACGGAMAPRYGSGYAPVGGRCGSCATTIA